MTRHVGRAVALMLAAGLAAATSGQERKAGDVKLEPGSVTHGEQTYHVEFGNLWVPMNRHDPAGELIRLRFVRYRSTSADPGPPVVYLAGGPGGSGIGTMQAGRARTFLGLLDEHDFIAFDQRGTGQSGPPGVGFEPGLTLPFDQAGDPVKYAEVYRSVVRRMLATMKERGVDVRGLTTEESADDLESLRVALGARRLVLWGSSYGTHLALATARRHPESVAALVLAGTEGPDHTLKLPSNIQSNLERLAALVGQDPIYAEKMPDFLGTLQQVLDDLEENPRTITLIPGVTVTVGKWDLQKALSSPMGSRAGMQEIPAYVYAMAHGEFYDLARWAVGFRTRDRISAMSVVMDCASYATGERMDRIARESTETLLGAAIDFPMPCLCEVEGMPRTDDRFRSPLRSDIPALFISGTLDGRTPVSNAEEIAQGFSHARHLIIRNASHGSDLFVSSPLILEAVRSFLQEGKIKATTIDGPSWSFAAPYEKSLAHEVLRTLSSSGYEATVEHYRRIRAAHEGQYVYNFEEAVLNNLGYEVMQAGMLDLALDVFRLNTVAHPEAFNTWDSLGEAYMNKGQLELAVENYQKSLQLNPDNGNAVLMLEQIRGTPNPVP